jgi:tape measure domain-containing protein
MQIQVDASDANKKLTEVDRNLTSIRSTSSETSSSLKRMEGTFARIEKTMRSVERTMRGVHQIMKYMAKANVAMGNSFKGLGKDISDINSKFNKFSSNISNISSKYATLKKQNKNLSDQINKLKQDMKALGSATGGAGTKTKETGGAFERLTKVLKENSYWVGSLVGGFLSLISIDLAGHFVRITDQLTLMKNRLGTVNPEVVKLRENFNTVVQIAMETRSNLAAVANLYSRIGRNSQRLQKDQEALARVVRTINQGFQLSGATAEEARNAIVQLSQAFASGRLQGDELRSVLELAPEAAKGLAKAIGITTGTMRRFAAEGMITTEVMVAAFEKASAETQAKFDNIKATISQAMENVRTAIYAGIEGAEEFGNANQLIANKIMSLANMIKNAKDQFSFIGKIVENVALNFEKFAAGIVAVVGVLGGMIIVSSLTALFSSFGAVIGLSAGAVAGLVTILGLLAYRLIDLNLEIKTTAEQLRPLDEVIKELSDSTKTGMDRLNGYREELANTKLASDELEVQLGVINRKINELSQSVINARGTWREYADDLLGFIQEYKIFGLDLILPGSDKQELAVLTERAAKLEKLQMDMADRTSKLREQEKKAMEEVKKGAKEIDPQELLLKEVYAKQAAFARQMELVGEALSNEFIQGFTNPFDSGLGGIQSALTRFTENVASKTASLFKSKLPEGIPLFDPKVLVKQASSFNQAIEEGLRSGKRVSLFGMPDENGIRQLTQEYKDVITSILGDPSTQAAFKEQDTLGKIMQAEMDSILREQLIDLEKAINQYIIQQNQKIKTEERSLKAQREQLELTEFSAKAEMDGLKKNTPLLKVQESIIEEEYRIRLLNYEQKLKDLNITGQTKNALMEELALQKDLAISLEKVNQEKKLYLELQGKQRDLVSATERVADLQLELDHLIKGTNELEKQKSLNETIIAREKVILDQRREREDLTDEQYRQELAILETKKSLLDLETDITEEIKKQNELRKTEDELARARLLDQAKTQAQQMKGQLSLFQQLGIGLGLVKDPTKDFVDRQEAFIDATIASGKKVSDLYMGRGGTGLQINPAVQRDMDETAMNIIKNRMELFEEKSKTTPLNNNLATRLLGQSKFAPQEMEYALQRKKGGMLSGPSHASGGIKGMLYGQAIELEGGEYVINKDAVAKYGIPMFNALNTMRFAPGGVLPGTELTPQEAMRIANNLRTAGKLKEAKKFSDAVAEDYARRGVPTFRADGTVIGDPKKMLQKGDTTKAVEEVTEGFVKMAPAIEEVTKESKKVEKEFTKTNEAIGYAGSSWKEIETLSQKEIDAIESVTSRRMTAEEEAAYAIKKVTETYRDSARDWKEAYAEAEMRMGPQTGLLGDGMMGQTAAGIGAVFADALGQSGAFKGFLEDIVMLTTNPVAGVTQILSKSLLQNERFQQALQRFLDIFYVLFDEVAEGLAILFEAIVDVLAPLKPLMQMIGGALRDIMRAFTQIIQPLAMLIESLQPILIYLSGFLQIIVGIFSSIVGGIASIFTNLFTNVLSVFGIDTQGYKSLNLLRQEKTFLLK